MILDVCLPRPNKRHTHHTSIKLPIILNPIAHKSNPHRCHPFACDIHKEGSKGSTRQKKKLQSVLLQIVAYLAAKSKNMRNIYICTCMYIRIYLKPGIQSPKKHVLYLHEMWPNSGGFHVNLPIRYHPTSLGMKQYKTCNVVYIDIYIYNSSVSVIMVGSNQPISTNYRRTVIPNMAQFPI